MLEVIAVSGSVIFLFAAVLSTVIAVCVLNLLQKRHKKKRIDEVKIETLKDSTLRFAENFQVWPMLSHGLFLYGGIDHNNSSSIMHCSVYLY